MTDHSIIVPIDNYGVVEDIHLMLEHMICSALKEAIDNSE